MLLTKAEDSAQKKKKTVQQLSEGCTIINMKPHNR